MMNKSCNTDDSNSSESAQEDGFHSISDVFEPSTVEPNRYSVFEKTLRRATTGKLDLTYQVFSILKTKKQNQA